METLQTLSELSEEYKDIFSEHKGDIGHTKLLNVIIDAGDHPPIAQQPYILPLKLTLWVQEE